jgi:NADH:ubiquinone reductase (H+-translocating)
MPSSHHIVVVGGGVAGLAIASKLKRTAGRIPIAVSLIDREPAYVWKPMLHAIAAGTSDFSQQETNYIAQFWRGGLIWLVDTINSYVRPKFRFARD